jgi:uncharacterized protein (DUF433 family)
MTTPTITEVGSLLYVLPSASGGRLCLTGSGVSVRSIIWLYNLGLTPEEIQVEYSHLTLPPIYAAIAYYLANKQRLDAQIAEDSREFDELADFYEKHGRLPEKFG